MAEVIFTPEEIAGFPQGPAGPPGPPGPPGSGGSSYRIMAADHGVVADGTTDDLAALQACLMAANTGSGGRLTVELPPGNIRVSDKFNFGSNVTWVGQGSRPGNQGGTEFRYDGPDLQDWFVAGSVGEDWSNSHLAGFRIRKQPGRTYTSGYALHVFNPTNAATLTDIVAGNAPSGQIRVDDGGSGTNPGPNYFRMERVWGQGGVVPFGIGGGSQATVLDACAAELDATSTHGFYVSGGVGEARPVTFTGCKVEGDTNVPGYYVTGLAPVTFIGCVRWSNAQTLTAPGFMYQNPSQPNCQVMCLNCTTRGTSTAFTAPDLGVTVRGSATGDGRHFNYIPAHHLMVGPFGAGPDPYLAMVLHKSCYLAWTDTSGSTQTMDTYVKRAGAGKVNVGKLAVGNSAIASETIGKPVARKIEVFDASGTSLGFVPVYPSIT